MHVPDILKQTGFRWGVVMAAALATGTMLMFGVVYWFGTAVLFRTADKAVLEQLTLLAARPPKLLPFMITSRMRDRLHNPHVITLVGLFDTEGRLITGDLPTIPEGLRLDQRVQMVTSTANAEEAQKHERVAGLRLSNGRVLVVARNVDDLFAVRRGILWTIALVLVPAFLLSIAGGVVVGVRCQRRLVELRRTAERIIDGHLGERLIARPSGDELDQLAAIVNLILDRLEELIGALKGAGEDIAHDLRTPLTLVRARLERGRDRAANRDELVPIIDQSIAGIDQALSILTALLRITEIERSKRQTGFTRFDLASIIRDAVDAYEPLAVDKGIALELDAKRSIYVSGDRDLMVEVVLNLVDNAIKFAPPRSTVSVAIAGTSDRPLLRVADNGPGIPEHEINLVFRRFYRSEKSRSSKGTGLGLSLVAAITKLHGFGIAIRSNQPGCIVELQCWNGAAMEQTAPDRLQPAVGTNGMPACRAIGYAATNREARRFHG